MRERHSLSTISYLRTIEAVLHVGSPHSADDAAREAIEARCWIENSVMPTIAALDAEHVCAVCEQRTVLLWHLDHPGGKVEEKRAMWTNVMDDVHAVANAAVCCFQWYRIMRPLIQTMQEQTGCPALFIWREKPVVRESLDPNVRRIEVVCVGKGGR